MAKELLKDVLENIDIISSSLDKNIFIANSRASFDEKISEFELADDDKSKLIASYEAQLSTYIIGEIIKLAKELPLLKAQIDDLNASKDVKKEQSKVTKEQVCEQKAKNKLAIEQVLTEQYRHRDLRASTAVKISANEVTKQQALFEEARRQIALVSNNQNTFMKKADYHVQQLQAMASDDKVVLSAEHIKSVKDAIEKIPTQSLKYESDVNVSAIDVKTDILPEIKINCEK